MAAQRIPGIPGVSEPHFRTGDRLWMSLDDLVTETCARLEARGISMGLMAVKTAVQTARRLVEVREGLAGDALIAEVIKHLRAGHVVLPPAYVQATLQVYALLVAELDVREIREF